MKKTLRLVSLFLVGIMLMALTACSGSSENELTSRINSKLSGTSIHVQYDSDLSEKALVLLDTYRVSGNLYQAMRAAGINSTNYALYATTATSTLSDAASVIAGNIRAERASSGRVARKLGYASGRYTSGQSVIFALVEF